MTSVGQSWVGCPNRFRGGSGESSPRPRLRQTCSDGTSRALSITWLSVTIFVHQWFQKTCRFTIVTAQMEPRPPRTTPPCFVSFVVQTHPQLSVLICVHPWFLNKPQITSSAAHVEPRPPQKSRLSCLSWFKHTPSYPCSSASIRGS